MKNLESFVNLYPLSKTLRFALLPIGKTEENFNRKQLLQQDQKRAEEYEKVKEYIDRYHKYYIESVLADECKISSFLLDNVREYAALYSKSSRDDKDEKNMEELEKSMRKSIADILKSDERYALLFKKEMITELLPGFLTDKDELASLDMFKNFTAYFTGFNTNRKNMYSAEEQSTAIPYRCINDNLPKFLDNVRVFKAIKEHLPEDEMTDLNETYFGLYGVKAEDMFCVDYFAFVLSQSGIDRYNSVIGGYKCLDGTKQKGVNECVNLYNQAHPSDRLPLLKPLYKQILSDKQSISFIPEKFKFRR